MCSSKAEEDEDGEVRSPCERSHAAKQLSKQVNITPSIRGQVQISAYMELESQSTRAKLVEISSSSRQDGQ